MLQTTAPRFSDLQHACVADVGVPGASDDEVGAAEQAFVDVFDPAGVEAVDVGRNELVAVHTRLHCADWIDFGDAYDHAFLTQALR